MKGYTTVSLGLTYSMPDTIYMKDQSLPIIKEIVYIYGHSGAEAASRSMLCDIKLFFNNLRISIVAVLL